MQKENNNNTSKQSDYMERNFEKIFVSLFFVEYELLLVFCDRNFNMHSDQEKYLIWISLSNLRSTRVTNLLKILQWVKILSLHFY